MICCGGVFQAWLGSGFRARLQCLSGVTPGNRAYLGFRRLISSALTRGYAQARSDSLEHSAVFIMQGPLLLKVLASSFLAGEPTANQIVARCTQLLGKRWRWLPPVARRYVRVFAGRTRPRRQDVVEFLQQDLRFRRFWSKHAARLSVAHWLTEPQQMRPVAAAASWNLLPMASTGDLAAWLGVTPGELEWFADLRGLQYTNRDPKLRHYVYTVLAKQSGSIRLIEAPKPRLKALQRRILADILDKIPVHSAAHGFCKGRSIQTFVAPHVGRRVVLRMDVRDFFPSFGAARVQAFFRTSGYPESVANRLAGICTTATPRDVWTREAFGEDPLHFWESRADARALYSPTHLPQGAPTSPALANLLSYRMDCRLAGLAKSVGATYTRYADDLAFSGDDLFERGVTRFSTHVAAILCGEGFSVHHRKTRIMPQGVRQHLAGLVTNQRVNVRRSDFDCLKAILTNCVRFGPESQNREAHPDFRAHLAGRVSFVAMVNPLRGNRLRKMFSEIQWERRAQLL